MKKELSVARASLARKYTEAFAVSCRSKDCGRESREMLGGHRAYGLPEQAQGCEWVLTVKERRLER